MSDDAEPETAADAAWVHDRDVSRGSIGRRPDDMLVFDPAAMPDGVPVMLDTNFYIAHAGNKLPPAVLAFVEARTVLHCGVALAELAVTAGLLDPADRRTPISRAPLKRLLDTIPLTDCRSPGPAAWAEAGMLSGILARTQLGLGKPKKGLSSAEACCQAGRRREALLDALIFLTAREQEAILVSSNIADMDLLSRFRPDVRVLLFRQV